MDVARGHTGQGRASVEWTWWRHRNANNNIIFVWYVQ